MMKKGFLVGLILICISSVAFAAEEVVFVNLELAFNEFYKTKLSKAQVDVQKNDMEDERLLRVAELELVSDEVEILKKEARDTTLSDEIRDEKRILYEERLLEMRALNKGITEFVQQRQKQLQMQVTRIGKILMDEIRQVVVDHATTEGFKAVVDSSTRGASVSVFIYTHPDVDITDDILKKLNSARPSEDTDELLFSDPESDEPSGTNVEAGK